MRASLFAAVGLAATTLVGGAMAQTAVSPRVVTGRVADQIEQHYFDPDRARTVAAELRAEAASGRYDAQTDPRDLAGALSQRLRPVDSHFSVTWSDPATRPAAAPAGPRRGPDPGFLIRSNYGFRRVEMLAGGVGYIDLRQFANFGPGDEGAKRAADAALAFLAGADAIIFDLRDNGGGSPAMVGYLIGGFVAEHADVYNRFHSRQGVRDERPPTTPAHRRIDVPIYVLTSARSASAAESFAYTLQAARRATVVGEPSAGGANPGAPADAGEGFVVFVSTGSPRNPITGGNWEGTGVRPDVETPAADALRRAHVLALERLVAGRGDNAVPDARLTLEALVSAPPSGLSLADYPGRYGETTVAAEGDGLSLRTGRRPPRLLRPLGRDLFFDTDLPSVRIAFERDADGRVTAMDQRLPGAPAQRRRREP